MVSAPQVMAIYSFFMYTLRLEHALARLKLRGILLPSIPRATQKGNCNADSIHRRDGQVEERHREHDRQDLLDITCQSPRIRVSEHISPEEKKE